MPLITVEDQGFFTPGQIIQGVAERMLAQKQKAEAIEREKQAFAVQQRIAESQATVAGAKAGNVGTEIDQGNERGRLDLSGLRQQIDQGSQLFPYKLRSAENAADTGDQQLTTLKALSPLQLREATARTATAEADQGLRPKLDPLKIRQAEAETTVAEQNAIPTDEAAEATTDDLGNITETVKKTKAGQPFGSASKIMRGNRPVGSTGGATKIEYVTDPYTGQVTKTLVTQVSPAGQISQSVLDPLAGKPISGTPAKPGSPTAKPTATKSSTSTAAKPAAAPTPASAATKSFADMTIGDEFVQNGTRYRKTGEKSAEPVGSN